MEILITAAQFILALSILITLHEFGHYWAARAFGIRIEKFLLFFDAWNFKLFSFKRGDTEYGMGWLPLGGYVKIAGMMDESLDTEQMKSEPQPWEYRSKPAWQRLIVMVGGVTVNLILGIILMISLIYSQGESYIPNESINQKGGVYASPVARSMGFATGDRIIALNGQKVENLDAEFGNPSFLMADKKVVDIQRAKLMMVASSDSTQPASTQYAYYDTTLVLPENFDELLSKKSDMPFFAPRLSFVVGKLTGGGNAYKAGFDVGDAIQK